MRFRLKSGHALGYFPSGCGRTTLVLLHPIGLRAAVWQPVRELLDNDYRVIAVDAPGHGDSDVPATPQSIDDMAAAVQELLTTIGGERIVPIGCSMGSAMAACLAARMPDKVVALVLANSSYHPPSGDRGKAQFQRAEAAKFGMPSILETTINRWFDAKVLPTSPEMVARVATWLLEGDPIVHSWCWQALGNFSIDPLLPKLAMPALALGGQNDKAAQPPATRALADVLTKGTYAEIAMAGHLSPLERPAEFAAAVRRFLERNLPA